MPLPKLFPLILVLTLFLSPVVSKAELLPLSATVNGTIITATLTGISPANIEKVDIFIQTDPFPTTALCPSVSAPCSATQPTKEVIGTTIKWTVKTGLTGGTTYNLRAEGKNGYVFLSNVVTVKTGSETIDALWPLTSTSDGNNAWIKGKLNNPSPKDFTAKLEYSVTNLKTDGSPVPNVKEAKALKTNTNNAVFGINDDGTYYYRLIDLTPGQQYSIRETIVSKNDARQIKVGSFNTKDGIILENSESAVKSDAQRSYSLLAPLPGLSVVLDNDLCREYVTAGKPVPGGSCDNQIGYFINLLIRMLIGLSVVILVVKIIFEGYQYMVTDIPFIKASAKSKLFESFFGLMLALASYLILNTINPRLVNGGVSIDTINLSIDDRLASSFSKYTAETGGPLSPDDIKKMRAQYGKAWDAVRTTYIPVRDSTLPTVSKGAKTLMTAQTTVEGFYPNTKSWRTNNPGNIGNTDNGATATFPTLAQGIQKQHEHLSRIVNGQNPSYKIGRVVNQGPVRDVATGITYPGINFTFDGSLYQYLQIYATGARKDNNYLSFVIAFFEKEGMKITGYTKISEIYNMK